MEDITKYIYYQVNTKEEILKREFRDYYIIEFQNEDKLSTLTKEKIIKLLINDGYNNEDIYLVTSFQYTLSESGKLYELNDNDIISLDESKILYIHLVIDEQETELENEARNEIDEYQTKIKQINKEIKKKVQTNINEFNLVEKKINLISKNKERKTSINSQNMVISYTKNNKSNKIIKRYNSYENKNVKKKISLIYLYSFPLYDKESNLETSFNDNFYYNQIFSIYNKFKDLNIYANLIFEPIKENFANYLEKGPNILHIKVNSSMKNNKLLYLNLDLLGILSDYSCENLKLSFQVENNVSKIKLIIFSSQNIDEVKKIFVKINIKNIIYINNDNTNENEKDEEIFIENLYEFLLKGDTIKQAFEKSKLKINNKNIAFLYPDNQNNNITIVNNYENNFYDKNSEITLNKNCALNLDFINDNYKMVIGRNLELNNCITQFKTHNKICLYGYQGVGKKSFSQKVGSYLFERNWFENVFYIEVYSLDDSSRNILNSKINEIKANLDINKNNDNFTEFDKKYLCIINFNFLIYEKDLKFLQQAIKDINDFFNFLYVFTIDEGVIAEKVKKIISFPLLELKRLNIEKQKNILNYCLDSKSNEFIKNKESKVLNEINGYPNDIYLRSLYINYFFNNSNINIGFDNLFNENLFMKIIESDKNSFIKIFCLFSILSHGISEDIFKLFFSEEEEVIIKEKLKYLILVDKYVNKVYFMDSSYIVLLRTILFKNYEYELLNYLCLILKNYALIFRYLVNNSNFEYDICFEFHAGINNDFWNSKNYNFLQDYQNFEKKNYKIYFEDVIYSNNIINLFGNKKLLYENIIKKEKEKILKEVNTIKEGKLFELSEYISQISICLSTILHFTKSSYENLITDFFLNSDYLFLNQKDLIRLKMFKYWTTGNLKYLPNELNSNDDKIKLNIDNIEEAKAEYYLIKIYDYIIKRQNYDIIEIFEKYKNYIIENYFNLSRLYILYGKYLCKNDFFKDDENDFNFFKEAENFIEKTKNLYLIISFKLIEAECYLNNYNFSECDKIIKYCEKQKEKNKINLKDISLKNSNIDKKIDNLKKQKNNIYNNYIKNKLFFYMSNPFYDEKGNSLKTESNNSFYLKYKLITSLPKNLEFEFKNIDCHFVDDLKKCLDYPIRFLYIGSDYFNDEGNLYYEDKNFICNKIENKAIKEILAQSKFTNMCDILILGILNGDNSNEENLYKLFHSKKFRHIIYLKKVDELNRILKENPIYYFYFQKCFINFIVNFMINLSKLRGYLTIKEAFRNSKNKFIENIQKLIKFNKGKLEEDILCLSGDEENDNDIFDFGNLDEGNLVKNVNNNIIKDIYDEYEDENMKKSNIYFRKNVFRDNGLKIENKDDEKKYVKYFKFPGIDSLRPDNFQRLINEGIFSMKSILRDLINIIRDNKYVNIYGNKFLGKIKICREVCKYFYVNNKFKKGIFIIKLKYLNKLKNISELNKRYNNKNKNDKSDDILIVFENVEEIKNNLFEWLKELDVHTIILSRNKKDKLKSFLENDNKKNKDNDKKLDINKSNININKDNIVFYDIDDKTEEYKKNNKEFEEEFKEYNSINSQNIF